MKRNDWRSYASGRHRKKRPSRRGKFLFPLGAVALALVLVMGVPYLLAQASLDAVISAAAATASPTRMPLWTCLLYTSPSPRDTR